MSGSPPWEQNDSKGGTQPWGAAASSLSLSRPADVMLTQGTQVTLMSSAMLMVQGDINPVDWDGMPAGDQSGKDSSGNRGPELVTQLRQRGWSPRAACENVNKAICDPTVLGSLDKCLFLSP